MKFLKTPNGEYWEINYDKMRLYNIKDDWHEIDESSEEWLNGQVYEYDSWSHLYEAKHFDPLKTDKPTGVMWISPTGECYPCDCHAEMAMWICRLIFDLPDDLRLEQYNDALELNGWIKVSDYMWTYYQDRTYSLTQDQYDALWDWCRDRNNDFPQDCFVADIATGTYRY